MSMYVTASEKAHANHNQAVSALRVQRTRLATDAVELVTFREFPYWYYRKTFANVVQPRLHQRPR